MFKILKKISFSTTVQVLLIVLLCILVYSDTFDYPFAGDDEANISDNPIIRDFEYFKNPSEIKNIRYYKDIKKFFESRYIGNLSFALNYRLHGLDVFGYHALNVLIHVINALLVYWLVIITFRTPYFRNLQNHNDRNLVAFFSALIFAVHPIQTQAVTYIVQRFTSLATLFYLLALVFYIKSRLIQEVAVSNQQSDEKQRVKAIIWYLFSVLSAVFAMKTKEISFTLPLMIALYEFMFFDGKVRRRVFYLIPIFLTMAIIPLTFLMAKGDLAEMSIMDESLKIVSSERISRWDYLFTQFRVVVTYIRLLILPINQNLDYDYPIYSSFFESAVFLSFLLLLSIFGLGIYLFYRSRLTFHMSRLTAFGIFWFFVTLSVESSIIPRSEIIFEHRIYLSSIGFIITVMTSLVMSERYFKEKIPIVGRLIIPVLIVVVFVFSGAAYARNTIWQNEISLWKDTVRKSPQKARTRSNLGATYIKKGKLEDAARELQAAIKIDRESTNARNNLGVIYLNKGYYEKALKEFSEVITRNLYDAKAHNNIGVTYMKLKRFDDAIRSFRNAVMIAPHYADAYNNRGLIYEELDRIDKAISDYRNAQKFNPYIVNMHNNLGVSYFKQGEIDKAIRKYMIIIKLKPDMVQAHYNLGLALMGKGHLNEAIKAFSEAVRLKPDLERAYYNLGLVYIKKGQSDKAMKQFQNAVRIKPDYTEAREELRKLNSGNSDG